MSLFNKTKKLIKKCPICTNKCDYTAHAHNNEYIVINCIRCGYYLLNISLTKILWNLNELQLATISGLFKDHSNNENFFVVNSDETINELKQLPPLSIYEKTVSILSFIYHYKPIAGSCYRVFDHKPTNIYPLISSGYCFDKHELNNLLLDLEKKSYITLSLDPIIENDFFHNISRSWLNITLNASGIEFIETLKAELEHPPQETHISTTSIRDINLEKLSLSQHMTITLKKHIIEIDKCFTAKAPLATIALCGSFLEGILFDIALSNPKIFLRSPKAPQNKQSFEQWTLNQFINVAKNINLIDYNTKEFSHTLRNLRNYIHPSKNTKEFSPTFETAEHCIYAIKIAVAQITQNKDNICAESK